VSHPALLAIPLHLQSPHVRKPHPARHNLRNILRHRHWYGLYNNTQQRGFDNLITFDPDGHKQSTHLIDQQQCGDPALDQHRSACGCRVVDASDPTQTLLSRCRTQRGDYAGMVRREWLSVLYTDHFSTAGFIPLSHKDVETLQALALGDGQLYVVTLESGPKT